MPRIVGVDIPNEQARRDRADLHLRRRADHGAQVCKQLGFEPRAARQGPDRGGRAAGIADLLDKYYLVEGALRRQIAQNIQRLRTSAATAACGTARGCRCAGQNTQSNARTRKGPRKTVAGKKGVKAAA